MSLSRGNGEWIDAAARHPSQPIIIRRTQAGNNISSSQESQFLLMCVNTKTSTALVHVKVDSLTSDQCLFQQMTEEYRRVRHEHEFRITNFFPLWASNLLRAISVRFPAILTLPGVLSNFPSMLSYALNGMHVHKISSGDFVRVRICHTYYSAQFRNQPAILTFSIVPAGANRDRVLSQMVQDTKYTPRG